jgi:tetratricopeptide (TPR) repeat protein
VVFGTISGTTDNACHFGGLAAGVVLGAMIAKAAPEPRLMPRLGVFALVAALLAGGGYALQRSRAYPYLLMRASDEIEEGKVDAAVPFCEAAVKLRPGSAGAIYSQLAQAYWEKKDLAGAERELQKVLQVRPKDEAALNDLGGIRLNLHRSEEARQSFAQLLALNPQSAAAHAGLGAVSLAEGNPTAALQEYEQAAELNGRLAGVYAKQGECLMLLKRYDEAIAAFRKQIVLSGNNAAIELALAEAYRTKGMTAEADAATQQAEKLKTGQ